MCFRSVEERHPGIFEYGDRLWSMDEMAVSAEFGKKVKVFGEYSSRRFNCRSRWESSRHITAVVAISASGRRAPPSFIISEKNIMLNWFLPLMSEQARGDTALQWISQEDWFPKDGVVVVSGNGNAQMRLITLLVQHIHRLCAN